MSMNKTYSKIKYGYLAKLSMLTN